MSISTPQNATLIDSLSDGYRAIHRRPWLLIVPIVLNAYLWFGVPLSFEPLISDLYGFIRATQQSVPQQSQIPLSYDGLLGLGRVDMRAPLALLNFVPTLAGSSGLLFTQAQSSFIPPERTPVQLESVAGVLLAFVLINAVVLPISAVFLMGLAEAIRDDWATAQVRLRRAFHAGLSIAGYMALLIGGLLVLLIPFALFAGLLTFISPALGLLMVVLAQIAVFWATVYVGFAPEAIVVSGIGPLRALRASVQIVWRNFWGTLGLLALSLVISLGTSVVWQQLTSSTAGAVVAIVGSAYIGSGLVAARMTFYRERLRRWHGK